MTSISSTGVAGATEQLCKSKTLSLAALARSFLCKVAASADRGSSLLAGSMLVRGAAEAVTSNLRPGTLPQATKTMSRVA